MKKLLSSLMVACLMFVATISTVGAVGSITADEQKIIDALEAGVTVDGVKVNLKAAADVLGLTIKVGADGTVTVYKGSEVVYSTTNVIKKTGYDFTQTAVMAAGLVAVLFGAGYYAKRKQLLVK